MGYCLLYESMLDTVLFARDKWLVSALPLKYLIFAIFGGKPSLANSGIEKIGHKPCEKVLH